MSRLQAFVMLVWWPVVWYLGMAMKDDYAPMDYKTYLTQMTPGETVLGAIYVYLGWFVKSGGAADGKDNLLGVVAE